MTRLEPAETLQREPRAKDRGDFWIGVIVGHGNVLFWVAVAAGLRAAGVWS